MKLDTSINPLELNLQTLTMKNGLGNGPGNFTVSRDYEFQVRMLVNELKLTWQSEEEVTQSILQLCEDQGFRDRMCFTELDQAEWDQFKDELIDYGYVCNWRLYEDDLNQFEFLNDQCFHYFNPVKITKSVSNYGYFLGCMIGSYVDTDYTLALLDYQLKNQFENDMASFSQTLICKLAKHHYNFSAETGQLVRDWIALKGAQPHLKINTNRAQDIELKEAVVIELRKFCKQNETQKKIIAAKTLYDVYQQKYPTEKIKGAQIARLFINKEIVTRTKLDTLMEQFKPADLDKARRNTELHNTLYPLV
jgi:hypothetical protein